ncbi:MAG: phosphoribosyl-AMP cyclohydrolase [Gammaproteobacteria bacterium]|nr:phosphoribosyl-AMP cyclohydrolase [Gammaproteobacteria bacterium]CAJ2377554.1 MAG: Phosphoribosyl-AMP cyclohydrolase [Arenicellales bacterium IbO2]MDA7967816.1 phosphoribosyl-AMP cyclohydrolase [Gammaproteobacteria bacterium]MDA7990343.1 phosphoribosyl-AMP cyclohydrolase [Gammaproteobacteria bacterium]MDA8007803.1 phosphoribosyl-AMP cyclohydrolase [Gammaproteobacteria bacterium]
MKVAPELLDEVRWDQAGLIPAIAQDHADGAVLMVAWMNRESLAASIEEGRAVYYSRSRRKLWRKGEESGNRQILREIRLDCDGDTLLLRVEQIGGIACHTGRRSCFYRLLENGAWRDVEPVLKDPREMYPPKRG